MPDYRWSKKMLELNPRREETVHIPDEITEGMCLKPWNLQAYYKMTGMKDTCGKA
jgi:hypothetical protein